MIEPYRVARWMVVLATLCTSAELMFGDDKGNEDGLLRVSRRPSRGRCRVIVVSVAARMDARRVCMYDAYLWVCA